MGTDRPHLRISSATLAGGEKNQDRCAFGDGWAFVLDGASSFVKTQSEHDGGWYAERLKQSLAAGLEQGPARPTTGIVEDAIRAVADLHDGDAASCPTSTIALARWDGEAVEAYLLGDSTAALISPDGDEVVSDFRLSDIARPLREEYRSRLRSGYGFDSRHRELLRDLQQQQAAARNRPDGYWVAGADPEAVHHGLISTRRPLNTLRSVVLATDGAAAAIRYGVIEDWAAFTSSDLEQILWKAQHAEARDAQAQRWPRSKVHDDKTTIVIGVDVR